MVEISKSRTAISVLVMFTSSLTITIFPSSVEAGHICKAPLMLSNPGEYDFKTTSTACQDHDFPNKWTIINTVQNRNTVKNISFNWAVAAPGVTFNATVEDETTTKPHTWDWVGPEAPPGEMPFMPIPAQVAGQIQVDQVFSDKFTTAAPTYVCPVIPLRLGPNVPNIESFWDGLFKDLVSSLRSAALKYLSSVVQDGISGLFTYQYSIGNQGDIPLPVYWEGITDGIVILDPGEIFSTEIVSSSGPKWSLNQVILPGIESIEVGSETLVSTAITVLEGSVPGPLTPRTFAHGASAYMPIPEPSSFFLSGITFLSVLFVLRKNPREEIAR